MVVSRKKVNSEIKLPPPADAGLFGYLGLTGDFAGKSASYYETAGVAHKKTFNIYYSYGVK